MEVYNMLVLTRRVEEGIMIGDDVLIKVLEIKGHQVKIGIEAPRATGVYRDEIYHRIQEENRNAPQSPPSQGILASTIQSWKNWSERRKSKDADNQQDTATQTK